MTKNLDPITMLEKIDQLVNNDFTADIECVGSGITGRSVFTQEEAKQMSDIILEVYKISHLTHCTACAAGRKDLYKKVKV